MPSMSFRSVAVLLAITFLSTPVRADDGDDAKKPPEPSFKERLARDGRVEMRKDGKRTPIAAEELVKLLENPPPVSGLFRGIRISGAEVAGELNLANADISVDVQLEDCTFSGAVVLSRAIFRKGLSFDSCEFENKVDMAGVNIAGNLLAKNAKFEGEGPSLDLSTATISGAVSFDGAIFSNEAKLSQITIASNLDAKNAKFLGKALVLEMRSAKIRGSVSFDDAEFHGWLDCYHADIAVDLSFLRSEFCNCQNDSEQVFLNTVHVGGSVFIRYAICNRPFILDHASVGINLEADGAKFNWV